VNGLLRPRVDVTAGQVERWRFIHGGVTQEIKVILRKASRPGTCKELDDTPIPLQQIAADGYTFPEKRQLDELVLEPGYRADVMLKAPSQEGTYCVVDAKSTQGLQGDSEAANLLAVLEVKAAEPGAPDGQTQLPSDEDLAKVARPTLDCAAPVDGTQEMIFAQQKDKDGKACEGIAGDSPLFNVNCKSYDPNHVRELILGHTDEWKLSSQRNGHPFHIHVNHFTVCPESGPAYWKDTLFVRQNEPITRAVTRYDDFTGEFVLHCHILQHEDQGMMEHEKIVDPPPVP
jgi:FtsP/CotA-like multicopper oxidase with cupredoxin domain